MSVIKLSKANLFYNLDVIASKVGSKNKIIAVLKDNAYSHGLLEIASMCAEYGIKACAVRNVAEARAVGQIFETILIFSEISGGGSNFITAIGSIEQIGKVLPGSRVHIKVDTGMCRSGIARDEIDSAIDQVSDRGLKLEGFFTHYKSSDTLSTDTFIQFSKWNEIKRYIKGRYGDKFLFHSCNSHSLFRFGEFNEDFVRVGIAMYGYCNIDSAFNPPHLKPVLSLYADRVLSKKVSKGDKIGYGGITTAPSDMSVSLYDVGYSDGYLRAYQERPTADGHTILGNISMDSMVVDVTEPQIKLIDDIRKVNRSEYEGLLLLNHNIKRVIE